MNEFVSAPEAHVIRILFLGDVMGDPGRRAVDALLPKLKAEFAVDFAIVNGENSAGGRGITPGGLVIGSESLYIDLSAEITIVDHVQPDPELLAKVRGAAPDALVLPIGTSGAVGGVTDDRLRVEAMEGFGVLRACELAGIPAVEIRAISNDLGEGDRSRWRIGRALEALGEALPGLLEAAAK